MDINPYEFIDNSQFELAEFCKAETIDALLFLSAWNVFSYRNIIQDHEPENQSDQAIDGIMNYWLWRLTPLMNKKMNANPYQKPWVFICADRVGKETTYTKEVIV